MGLRAVGHRSKHLEKLWDLHPWQLSGAGWTDPWPGRFRQG